MTCHLYSFHKSDFKFFKKIGMAVQFPSPSLFRRSSTIIIKLQKMNTVSIHNQMQIMQFCNLILSASEQHKANQKTRKSKHIHTRCKVDLLIYSSAGHEFFLKWKILPLTMLPPQESLYPPQHRTELLSSKKRSKSNRKMEKSLESKSIIKAWCWIERVNPIQSKHRNLQIKENRVLRKSK